MSSTSSSPNLGRAIYQDTQTIRQVLEEVMHPSEEGEGGIDPIENLIQIQTAILTALEEVKQGLEELSRRVR